MIRLSHSLAIAALAAIALNSPAFAEAAKTDMKPSDMKVTDQQCNTLWSQALGSNTGDLAMDKANPFVKDFSMADKNGDKKLSQTEWTNACKEGWIHSASNAPTDQNVGAGAAPGAPTSDRSGGNATERAPGSTQYGAPGTDAGQTPSGTSDRTPKN